MSQIKGTRGLIGSTLLASIFLMGASPVWSADFGWSGSGDSTYGGSGAWWSRGGSDNTAIGYQVLYNTSGSYNVGLGTAALTADTTGSQNTAIGAYSMPSNTTGEYNSALGFHSLRDNTTGDNNTAIGAESMKYNTTGSNNTALGQAALNANITGSNNIAIGKEAGTLNETGSNNVNIGTEAGSNNTSGSSNVNIGYQAGLNNLSGSNNVFIGNKAGANETGSNKLYIANSNTSSPLIYGEFDNSKVTINGALTVTGTLTADQILNSSGNSVMRYDSTNGAVHIGQNSMIFYDAAGAVGNGTDIMASSTGKIQIGKNASDTTTFVGSVNVPDPRDPGNAASKRYVDSMGAVSLAAATARSTSSKGGYLSAGSAVVDGQAALALGWGFVDSDRAYHVTTSYNPMLRNPTLAVGTTWKY
jgi:hypothetical protein